MAGWASLGNVLGGGIDREGAYLEGRYRSAQTEGALATARRNQVEAIAQERAIAARDKIELNPASATPEDWALAGLGTDYSGAQTGALTAQNRGYKERMVNPQTDYATLQRLRAAVGDSPFNPIDAVGTKGAFIDTRNPDLAVQKPIGAELFPDESGDTTAGKNYDRFIKLGGAPGPDSFLRMVRSDVVNAGGVPYARGATGAAPIVSREETAGNAGAVAGQKTLDTGMAKRTLDLPRAKSALAANNSKWDGLTNVAKTLQADENLWSAVGLGRPIASILGTEGARIRAQINTLKAKVGFAVLQDMREASKTGGALGNISNQENVYLQNALAALDANLKPEDFREQLQILIDYADGAKQRMADAYLETYPELGTQPAAATPGAAPAAGGATLKYVRDANGKLVRAP